MKKLLVMFLIGLLWGGLGCGANARAPMEASANYRNAPARVARAEAGLRRATGADDSVVAGKTGGQAQPVEIERKVIYTGWFTVDTYDLKEAQGKLVKFAESVGGYMQSTSSSVVVIRVPADKFVEVEPLLRSLGRVDDTQTRIQSQDVTEQYYDLQLRLKSKKVLCRSWLWFRLRL